MDTTPDRGIHVPSASSPAPAPPCTLVIFGANGDLTRRLLMPSLHNLAMAGLLADGFAVLGVDRNARTDEAWQEQQTDSMRDYAGGKGGLDEEGWAWLRSRLAYLTGSFEDPETYRQLAAWAARRRETEGNANLVFYLATPPRFFEVIIGGLAEAGLMGEGPDAFRRIVVEKPFGTDLASAKALNARILGLVEERQVFRIDHFLGKETVQNILALRFANGLFEPLWRRDHIDHVQITVAETVGVGTRGRFYEPTGALRDMVPNHLMQLLAMVAMEPPNTLGADAIRAEKAKVVQAIRPLRGDDLARAVVRGQYRAGALRGEAVPAYREEANVAPDSATETYVALRLEIDNWRWAGVPFYLRTGKRLAARRTEIAIHLKQAPHALFRGTAVGALPPNVLVLHIQPEEGVSLGLSAKVPGPRMRLSGVRMAFDYAGHFGVRPSTGYETLLYDALSGDASLFQRADNVEAGWAAIQPVLDAPPPVQDYAAGGEGPEAAEQLLACDGRHWLPLG
ncbi:glucose-6-phosphate dehydrogenase [Roseomonas sp. CCTCC AB2023176]|uniref:glucose-6-phosphate dehydrogenase n=1 Tax=Roseomonas sp. CCTCC AB2023176 TaxID=3342640 RepID=UPI0035E361E9